MFYWRRDRGRSVRWWRRRRRHSGTVPERSGPGGHGVADGVLEQDLVAPADGELVLAVAVPVADEVLILRVAVPERSGPGGHGVADGVLEQDLIAPADGELVLAVAVPVAD